MAALCSLIVLVSAFLLFAVQPMVAKMLLPNLGGSPSVWNTAMVFYQAALLLGYLYAHLATRMDARWQRWVHAALLLAPAIVLPLAYGSLHPPATSNPSLWMLGTMAVSVGLPFFVLSATSPLVQAWFARAGGGDPYHLYAAGNVGSFLGLLAYPILIEPRLTVDVQSQGWTWGYAAFAALFVLLIAFLPRGSAATRESTPPEQVPLKRKLRWAFLAFVPSSHFIGVTTYLTTDIAVMPLLWVIPLAIYLLSMVLVFAKRPPIPHAWVVRAFPVLLALLVFLTLTKIGQFRVASFAVHLMVLFAGAMLCHGELAKDRPAPSGLTGFFLVMSFGGVLGGAFNALVAPTVFVQVAEYSIALALAGLALPNRSKADGAPARAFDLAIPIALTAAVMGVAWAASRKANPLPPYGEPIAYGLAAFALAWLARRPLRFALAVGGLLFVASLSARWYRATLFADRSFFGVYRVEERRGWRYLLNGQILHGEQNAARPSEPMAYYHPLGPLKEVLRDYPRPHEASVAAVGLGVGSVALWSRPGERWTFFEIDPIVERIARDASLFTCIALAKGRVDVVIGDARLKLAESEPKFDVILVDAFSSDAIPVHLLTLEALQMYGSKLTENGVLAIHTSNRYLQLEPLLAALAHRLGWAGFICDESRDPVVGPMVDGRAEASWAVMGPMSVHWPTFATNARWKPLQMKRGVEPWTDGFSSLLPLLRPEAFRFR